MEIKQLEAFVHVAELGGFTRAATILNTTQPALSRLVRQLEIELRQHLLTRNGRGVALTDAGKVLLAHAQGIVQQVERAKQNLSELRGTVGGHFSIGLLPSIARVTTVTLVRDFHEAFPDASISIAEGLSTYLIEWLLMGRLDAAVLYDTSHTPLVEKRLLFEQELFLIGPPSASRQPLPAVPFDQIGNYPLISPSRAHGVRHTIETRAAELGIRLKIALEVDAVSSILDLICDGFGHAVLPANVTNSDPLKRKFAVHRLRDPAPLIRLVLATSRRHPLSKLAKQAIEIALRDVLMLCRNDLPEGESGR